MLNITAELGTGPGRCLLILLGSACSIQSWSSRRSRLLDFGEAGFGYFGERLALFFGCSSKAAGDGWTQAQHDRLTSGGFASSPWPGTASEERLELHARWIGQCRAVQTVHGNLVSFCVELRLFVVLFHAAFCLTRFEW